MQKLFALLGLVAAFLINEGFAKKLDKAHEKKSDTVLKKDETPVKFTEVEMDALKEKVGKAVIVDARAVKKDDKIIKGALVIPADADDKLIKKMIKDKDAEIIVYCGNKQCPASNTLAYRLADLGYKNLGHYAGGITEWTENNLETEDYKG